MANSSWQCPNAGCGKIGVPGVPQRRSPFGREFARLLTALPDEHVQQKHVAHLVGVDPSQLSRWLAGSERIGEPDLYRIAWILAGLQDGSIVHEPHVVKGRVMSGTNSSWKLVPGRRLSSGRGSFGALLKQLQQAAGYLPYDTDPNSPTQDILFDLFTNVDEDTPGDPAEDYRGKPTRLQRQLTVGYFGEDSILEADTTNLDRGIAKQIVDRLAVYLGVKIEWKRIEEWASFGSLQSLEHRVHMFAPRMAIPRRSFALRFTRPLPLLSCGINAIGRSDLLDSVLGSHHEDVVPSPAQLLSKSQLDQLLFAFVPGNIGEFAGSLFSPLDPALATFWELWSVDQISPVALKSDRDRNIESVSPVVLGEAAQKLLSMEKVRYAGSDRVPVLVTGQLLCYQLLQQFKDLGPRPIFRLTNSLAPVPYSFGVAHTEPKLFEAVNYALQLIYSDVGFMTELYLAHIQTVKDGGDFSIGQAGAAILDRNIERGIDGKPLFDRASIATNLAHALRQKTSQ